MLWCMNSYYLCKADITQYTILVHTIENKYFRFFLFWEEISLVEHTGVSGPAPTHDSQSEILEHNWMTRAKLQRVWKLLR